MQAAACTRVQTVLDVYTMTTVHVGIYIYIHVYLSISISIYIYIYIYICMCICIKMSFYSIGGLPSQGLACRSRRRSISGGFQ